MLRIILSLFLCFLISLPALAAPKKVLVVSHTAGFRHSSIPTAEKVLGELAAESGKFSVDYCRNAEEVKAMLTPDNLSRYDGVFFANTTGNLGIPQMEALLAWLKDGKAFFGAHSAADTYRPGTTGGDRRYIDMLGGEFAGHGQQCAVDAIVDDPTHASVAHLAPVWNIFDEIYIFSNWDRQNVRMLLSMNSHPMDGSANAGKAGDYPIAWVKRHGQGRVWYTSLGHREDVWENPKFKEHALKGILWGLGLEKGAAKPGIPQPKLQK